MGAQACSPWILPEEMCCEGDSDVTTCDGTEVPLEFVYSDEDYALAASNILFARTCYLYPGAREATIWPCMAGCCLDHPYDCAPCIRGSVIRLDGYRPRDITVTIDGVVVDPDSYRVQGGMLIRTDGEAWPRRNNFGIGDGVETIVSYTHGAEPPIELKIAAAALACELKTACDDPSNCAVPSRVQSISRQGVSMTLMDLQMLFATDKTGIPAVDYALDAHSDCFGEHLYDLAARPKAYPVPPGV